MSVFSKLDNLRSSVRSGVLSRCLAVLLGGSLNQKVVVILGLAIMAGSLCWIVLNLWPPLICGLVGTIITYLAMRDFERESGKKV